MVDYIIGLSYLGCRATNKVPAVPETITDLYGVPT